MSSFGRESELEREIERWSVLRGAQPPNLKVGGCWREEEIRYFPLVFVVRE